MGQSQQEISTLETQELIHKRRVQRFCITKGVDRGKLIDRVNVISEERRPLKRKE